MMEQRIKTTLFKQNQLNKEAQKLLKEAQRILKGFHDKRVTKANHSLTKALEKQLEHLTKSNEEVTHYEPGNKATLSIWFRSNEYDIHAVIKYCYLTPADQNGVCGSDYFEQTVYIASLKNHKLNDYYYHNYELVDVDEQVKLFRATQRKLNEVIDLKDNMHFRIKDYLSTTLKQEVKG